MTPHFQCILNVYKGRGFMKIKGGFLFSVLLLDFEAIAEETMI